jgi:hypothetical protein
MERNPVEDNSFDRAGAGLGDGEIASGLREDQEPGFNFGSNPNNFDSSMPVRNHV